IFENVSSFLKRLDKGIDEFMSEEINNFNSNDSDEENNENEADINVSDQESLSSTLLNAINEIKNW
ncbi:4225_t:CDS:1, partial [Entrophospora sp. SA101]